MKCPYCGNSDIQVKDSRPTSDAYGVKRRRYCTNCKAKFVTIERIELRDLLVIKKNGRRKPFDREKIFRSMQMALRKRNVEPEKLEQVVNEIVSQIEKRGESEIPTKLIGSLIMEKLALLDQVAYIRFASVYCEFNDAKDFEIFIRDLLKRNNELNKN